MKYYCDIEHCNILTEKVKVLTQQHAFPEKQHTAPLPARNSGVDPQHISSTITSANAASPTEVKKTKSP